jgi:hypothetical protein
MPEIKCRSKLEPVDRLAACGLHVRERGGAILKVVLLHVPLVVCIKFVYDEETVAIFQASSSCYWRLVARCSARQPGASG